MKITYSRLTTITLLFMLMYSCNNPGKQSAVQVNDQKKQVTKRVGMVIKIKPEFIDEYKALHADSSAGVRDLLSEANMHNFSIFLHQLDDGNWYEFGYYEYTGDNFEADMAKLDSHPRNIEWLKLCDPMQIPLEGYEGWAEMEQVYYNE